MELLEAKRIIRRYFASVPRAGRVYFFRNACNVEMMLVNVGANESHEEICNSVAVMTRRIVAYNAHARREAQGI